VKNSSPPSVVGTEEYYYDHGGQRVAVVSRDTNGTITGARIFAGDTEIELSATGAVSQAYAYLSLGTPVAKVVSPAGGWSSSGAAAWSNGTNALELQYHGLSSNTLLSIGPTATVKSGFVYAPYGDVIQTTGSSVAAQHRRFNDKFQDDLTKLSYYGVRYYDPLSLNWTQADPMYRFKPDSAWKEPRRANLYGFCASNPVRYVDPDGRDLLDRIGSGLFGPVFHLELDMYREVAKLHSHKENPTLFARRFGSDKVREAGIVLGLYTRNPILKLGVNMLADKIDDRDDSYSGGTEQKLSDGDDVLGSNASNSSSGGGGGFGGGALRDGERATQDEIAASRGGPTGGTRVGQSKVRQSLLDDAEDGPYVCWRCGQETSNPDNMHVGHRNVPTSQGGNLDPANVCLEGAACNLSSGNRGGPSPGMSCAERGSCGAPYGRVD
jgi:RHS repeat-associated protein